MGTMAHSSQKVNFATPRSFFATLKSDSKETFFPDDPFRQFKNEKKRSARFKKAVQYFIPVFEWLPKYNLRTFHFDLLAGITITSLAIPQGISYAKLANLPPIIGLYSSFVPPLIYSVFGNSKHIAIGTVAACSLLISDTIGQKVSFQDEPELYLHLVFTVTFFTGIFQSLLGLLRMGILVDFLSHSTITGFMGGTATLIILQQLKGMLGMKHFTTKTDVVSVLTAVFKNRHEWHWQSAVVGVIFLIFLQFTRFLRRRKPNLFWVSAISPMLVVVAGCLFAYFAHADKHGIPIVGDLRKGLNPLSIKYLNFDSKYLPQTIKAGLITGLIALAEGIAIGRSFAIMRNEQVDGNKEMIAFGFMNIVGSFTSCYLTTGPFSKSAVNFNSGCRTQMANVVMSICMMLTLLFLAPLFSYTPLVALSAIIMSAMFGLINYEEIIHLFKVDKFDFLICLSCFLGVAFISMDYGLMISIGLALVRLFLNAARPATCRLGKIPDSNLYRDTEQYPGLTRVPGILALQVGSPIYFANSNYLRERILRWIKDEEDISDSKGEPVEHVLLDLSGVTSIDITGIESLIETHKILQARGIKMAIINPRLDVMEKMIKSLFTDKIGKESVFLSVEDAVEASLFSLSTETKGRLANVSHATETQGCMSELKMQDLTTEPFKAIQGNDRFGNDDGNARRP
ncbi:probable sulfate transporter 3.5 [Ricinus communis]|uniref:Sulfate transporter, putative n=1 Tax=Ricinus communis TaxID=3988 RepID=B9RPC1_RICCO|nr:probable sulfate transporter 3.5 [Ricinus communis]EEF47039.1 sulfate transporter, putative [Ricinus communis]|eukprot:XP_002515590.1 probable sulfate transporter 3.5 [Ricinus communis]